MSAARPTPPDEPPNIVLGLGEEPAPAGGDVSPRFSFKGWSFQTWAVKNASFVKTTLAAASTATGAIAVTDLATLKAALLVWGLAVATIGFRAGADAVHYFLVEQKEPRG